MGIVTHFTYPGQMKDSVYGWVEDPAASGQHSLVPVTYSELVTRLVAMVRSTSLEHLSSTDSDIVAAAIKLCNKPIVIPCGLYNVQIYLCAEPKDHKTPYCVSKEGWVGP